MITKYRILQDIVSRVTNNYMLCFNFTKRPLFDFKPE